MPTAKTRNTPNNETTTTKLYINELYQLNSMVSTFCITLIWYVLNQLYLLYSIKLMEQTDQSSLIYRFSSLLWFERWSIIGNKMTAACISHYVSVKNVYSCLKLEILHSTRENFLSSSSFVHYALSRLMNFDTLWLGFEITRF